MLKYAYGANRLAYMFNQESVVYNILSKVKKPVGGRGQFILPIIVQNAGAFTGIAEGGALPTALDMDTAEATFSLQEFVAVYTMSWKLIQDSRNDKFAFQQATTALDESVRKRVLRNLNADFLDDGRGRLAVMAAVDDGAGLFTSRYLPRLEKGMKVDVMANSDDDTKRGDSLTVTGVDPVAMTVQLSGAVAGESAGDYAVIEDTTDISVSSVALHTNGLLGIINSANPATVVGNFGAINRSTAGNEYWKAPLLSNNGSNRPLTEDLLLQAMDAVRVKGGGQLKAWLSNLPILRRYHEFLVNERYVSLSSPQAIGGGFGRKGAGEKSEDGTTPYEFSGIPWHVDPFMQNNTVIGMDTDHFFIGVGDNDVPRPVSEIFDNVPNLKYTSNATFDVNWYYQCEVLSDFPAAGVQVQDVAEA
jgi:hypothetical protein